MAVYTITATANRLGNYVGDNYSEVWAASTAVMSLTGSKWIGQRFASGGWLIDRPALRFDTSSVTGIITSAEIHFHPFKWSNHDCDLVIQNGQPTYPSNPVVTSDYNQSYYSGNGGSINTSVVPYNFSYSPGYTFSLNSTGISWINAGGITKFIWRSSDDIAANEVPNGGEFSIQESGKDPPQLIITTDTTFAVRTDPVWPGL
jgi:hypothetical protein